MYARETGFSGPEILAFFSEYSLDVEPYPWEGGAPSRWMIFEDCLARFPVEQQKRIISHLLDYDGPMKYGPPPAADVERIREWLDEGPTPIISAALDTQHLNWTTVRNQWRKAAEAVRQDPAGAITAARTLVESVCLHVLSERGIEPPGDGDLTRLYRAASRACHLAPDQATDEHCRKLLGGCATAVNGVAGVRNAMGDAHGRGPGATEAEPRHARLAVNAAGTVALFLIESHLAEGE
jgi:hypothetical protein